MKTGDTEQMLKAIEGWLHMGGYDPASLSMSADNRCRPLVFCTKQSHINGKLSVRLMWDKRLSPNLMSKKILMIRDKDCFSMKTAYSMLQK